VKSRIDTAIEVDYYKHGGILPYVLRELISKAGRRPKPRRKGASRRTVFFRAPTCGFLRLRAELRPAARHGAAQGRLRPLHPPHLHGFQQERLAMRRPTRTAPISAPSSTRAATKRAPSPAHLKRLGIPVDRVYASPFCRTVETAMLAFGKAEKTNEARGGPLKSDDPKAL
jgi:hypothetical protein